MRKTLILLICFISFFAGNNKGFSQNNTGCNAELTVEKNRNIKSVGENGAFFNLILKNTSSTTKTYTVNVDKTKQSCKKSNNITSKEASINPELDLSIILPDNLTSKSSDTTITINGGGSQKFYVKVNVPNGTPYYSWSCLEVSAKSENCSSSSAKTVLSVYITNPSEE
ncbi:Fn3 domain-containing protein [Jejuia pallidilutea]|uniref:Fn3 domain-containing protein n=1 Tax=Jejuia pallidilutea TaxID=504487 RepID=A0A362WXD2_9FLAO|nr:Fn3-like domain-containing protein [Jejuia pallidilutea]PQV46209.1 Fn3 domain-containing protein [Jejuia pallidilutea]